MSSGETGTLERKISMTVNDERLSGRVEPRLKLTDFLSRHGHTEIRVGCEHGACGACSILKDGQLIKSCMLYAVQADGAEIETTKGLTGENDLHLIQQAFNSNHALQCGFCTSGFVMATKALLEETPEPSREEILDGLSSNICRCTGYHNIVDAVEQAAELMDRE